MSSMQPPATGNILLSNIFEQDVEKSTLKPMPRLRADLQLLTADHNKDGLPSWTLYDPIRGKFFRIGWVEFEILKRWNCGTIKKIVHQVNHETTIRATANHVEDLQKMLIENELVEVASIGAITKLLQKKHARPVSVIKQLFMFSLFYKKPLINPDSILQYINLLLQPVYKHKSLIYGLLTLLLVFVGFGLITHAHELKDTFVMHMNPTGYFLFALVLILTNVLHEIGHGLVAKRYGCSVRQMGVALIFMLPVCYCDTTDAWKLNNHRKRLRINSGGIAAEAVLALFAGLLWLIFPDGILKTLAFFVAVTSLGTTLLINLNPFLKFDGYYLLADFLQIDNFQSKSFATMRWQLRTWVIGHQGIMPYRVSDRQKHFMCLYAAATWLYRFFLYQIIALMVYQFWFKVLGVILMMGVIYTMLIQPVVKELVFYSKSIKEHGVNTRTLITSSLFIVFMLLLLVPLPRSVSAPAVLSASEITRVFAPTASKVKSVHVQIGDNVSKGQILIELEDPELIYLRDALTNEIELIQFKLSRQANWQDGSDENQLTQNHLKTKQAALADIQQSISQLTLLAIESGQIVSLPNWLTSGVWVAQNDVVAELAQVLSPEVRAYVSAQHVDRVQHSSATFYTTPDNVEYPLEAAGSSSQSISVLTDESLAISYGGAIAVEQDINGELNPIQDWSQIRLRLRPANELTIDREKKGYVMFAAEPRSIAASAISRTYGMLIRESGF